MTDHVDTANTAKTVRVRVKVLVDKNGKWAAYAHDCDTEDSDGVIYDMMEGKDIDTARSFYLIADIPVPQSVEVQAKVESCDE